MEKARLICFLINNNHIYNVGSDNIFKQEKNCYIVTKYGSMAHPLITYDEKIDGKVVKKNIHIGSYYKLVLFLKSTSDKKVFLRGFDRATIGRIFRLVLTSSNKDNLNVIDNLEIHNTISKLNFNDGITQECRVVANYIIEEINKYNEGKLYSERIVMTIKRLQKLLYFCDVEYMIKHEGIPLFNDVFHAWPSGPVIPEIYNIYMMYHNGDISPIYDELDVTITEEMKLVVDSVLEELNDIDTLDMIEISNIYNGPWAQVFDAKDKYHLQIISKEEMYKYYSKAIVGNTIKRLIRK